MSNSKDANSLAGQILGNIGREVDESKRLVEFEDLEDEFTDEEEVEEIPDSDFSSDEAETDSYEEAPMEPMEDPGMEDCGLDCEVADGGSMLDRMADLAADAEMLSADLAGIATDIGGGSVTADVSDEFTDAESEEIDVAMIDDIEERIDSIAASMEALRNR